MVDPSLVLQGGLYHIAADVDVDVDLNPDGDVCLGSVDVDVGSVLGHLPYPSPSIDRKCSCIHVPSIPPESLVGVGEPSDQYSYWDLVLVDVYVDVTAAAAVVLVLGKPADPTLDARSAILAVDPMPSLDLNQASLTDLVLPSTWTP